MNKLNKPLYNTHFCVEPDKIQLVLIATMKINDTL